MGDLTFRGMPKFMNKTIVESFSYKLFEYTKKNGIKEVFITFHGGEPMLLDKDDFIEIVEKIKNINLHLDITFLLQTNGVLLDEKWGEILNKYNIFTGISIDGPKKINDYYRKKHNGKGSYDSIVRNLKLLKNNNLDIVKGVISVVNYKIPVKEFYTHIKKINRHQLNLLLPDINYSNIPNEYMPLDNHLENSTKWLIKLYEFWKFDENRISIPIFEIIIRLLSGYENYGNHLIGNCENGVVVIETNGSIEVVDSLRISFNGATRGNINVIDNNIDDFCNNDLFKTYYYSHTKYLPNSCEQCSVKNVCGGGFLAHRYNKKEDSYNNPSIYCSTLFQLILYIKNDLSL